jgi:hypothetical protein
MTKRTLLLTLAFILIPAMASFAGTGYPMKCTDCGYSSQVRIGGGKRFDQITGYCPESKKFVYLTWKRGEKKPEPVAQVWDSATGKMIDLYKCPDCSKLFMPVQGTAADRSGPGFDCCPKCGKHTFKLEKGKGILMFD